MARFLAAVLALVTLVGASPAQQTQMTLAEAVRRALDVQPALIQARGDQRNADAGRRSATGAFLPSLTVSGGSLNAPSTRYNQSTGQIVNSAGTSYSGSIGLNLDLFEGFRRLANRRAAAATADAADAGVTNQRYQVMATTAQLFFTALADDELVRVAQAQVDRAKTEHQVSVNKFQAGAATRSDTLTSTVDLGNAQLALLQAQGNLATAQANLGRQVGEQGAVQAAPDSAFPTLPDTTGLRPQVLDGSPQVRQADAQASAARAQVSAARAEYWPTLSASYSNSYASVDTLGRFAVQPWLTTQSYVNSWGLRFSLSWTLFNGFTREADQVSAAVQRDVADAHAADLRRQVNALYTQQVSDLFTADAQIGITAANVAAAAEALRVQQERYRLGAATLLDLLTAEANLTQAEVNQVQARYTYLIARAQLEALVGRSL
jgi:outer membrane protein TolC